MGTTGVLTGSPVHSAACPCPSCCTPHLGCSGLALVSGLCQSTSGCAAATVAAVLPVPGAWVSKKALQGEIRLITEGAGGAFTKILSTFLLHFCLVF